VFLFPSEACGSNGTAAEEVQEFAEELLKDIFNDEQKVQIGEQSFNRFLYTYFGVTFSKTPFELEKAFWEASFNFKPVEGIKELFSLLDDTGIRKAILSNNAFVESILRDELEKYFKKDEFEFIISTVDYCFRKPSPLIFNLALRMAKLNSDEVWYAGNSFICDVYGASNAEIFPVWYNSVNTTMDEKYKDIEYLEISEWNELSELLKTMI